MESINPYKQQDQDQSNFQQGLVSKSELDTVKSYYENLVKDLRFELEEVNMKLGLYKNILNKIKQQNLANTKMFDLFVN